MLKLTIGNVNSDKTSLLKDCVEKELKQNNKVIIYYSAESDKKDVYVSKTGEKYNSTKIFHFSDLFYKISKNQTIIVDDVQFIVSRSYIPDFMEFLEHCDKNGINVYMFGLILDYLGEPFEIVQKVIPYVDQVEFCTRPCEICGKPTNMSIRYNCGVPDTKDYSETIMLESDSTKYKPVCRECFRKLTGLEAIK